MNQGIKLLVYPVQDLAAAKTLFAALLGVEPYVDAAYYVGFKVGDLEVGLDPKGHRSATAGPVAYCDSDDVASALQALLAAGAQLQQDVKNVGGGVLTALVKDSAGNVVGMRQLP